MLSIMVENSFKKQFLVTVIMISGQFLSWCQSPLASLALVPQGRLISAEVDSTPFKRNFRMDLRLPFGCREGICKNFGSGDFRLLDFRNPSGGFEAHVKYTASVRLRDTVRRCLSSLS